MHNGDALNMGDEEDLEQLLLGGITQASTSPFAESQPDVEEDAETFPTLSSDIQGSLGLFAEAAQDMATAGVELALGRHFACVDFCNQVAEKAAQAVSLRLFGHRSPYNHDLRTLAALVDAPAEIQDAMEQLTPFHPEAFYVDTPPEEADEVVSAEQASTHMQQARGVLRWARSIVLNI